MALLAKLESGEPLDSMTDATPVDETIETTANTVRTISTFADGSRRAVETDVEAPSGTRNSRSVLDQCTSSAEWKVNCRVGVYDAVSSASFRIDYKTGSPAQVRDYRAQTCANAVGGCSASGGIVRSTQNSAGAAWARLTYKADVLGISAAQAEIGLRVSGTTVSTY